nr:hypothetical protein [Tanacetum cinerariifolium]
MVQWYLKAIREEMRIETRTRMLRINEARSNPNPSVRDQLDTYQSQTKTLQRFETKTAVHSCDLTRSNSASFKTRLRFVSRRCYVLSQKTPCVLLQGSYKMGTFRETLAGSTEGTPPFGPERPRVYSDLSTEEKDRYNADIRATNILLQGLPKDIYTLINHNTDAKDIWDNVRMILEGSELTKEDRESQLYDDFEHFRQHKEESIHDYYVRFSKLINDMRNIKMTMSRLQLNFKFVNNMLLEWRRFIMAVKLNRGLRDSNYDQLFAYLKQHETHAKENKMMLEPSSSTQVPPPLANSSFSVEDLIENLTNTLALLTQSYRTFLPQTSNQLRTSSNVRNQATVQDGRVVVQNVQGRPNRGQGMNPRGGSAAGYWETQNRVGNVNQGQARPSQARTVKCYNCNGTRKRSSFGRKAVEDCDAFDLDVDEAPTAQTMFMANLSSVDPITDEAGPSYDSDIMSECTTRPRCGLTCHYTSVSNMILYDQYVKDNEVPVVHGGVSSVPNDAFMMIYNDMEQVELYERRVKFELTEREQKINEQLRLVISDRNFKEETLKRELHSTKLQLASTINRNKSMVEETTFLKKDFKQKENKYLEDFLNMKSLKEKVAIGYKNPLCLTRAKQTQPALYNGHEILKDNHALAKVHNTEDTLEIAEITRKKINAKMTDPECVTRKVKIAPHDYSKENFLATFTPEKQLTPEQIYWSNDLMKLKSEALKERTKRITPTGLTEGKRGFEQTKACYLQEVIPFFKTIKDNFKVIQKALTKEVKEMKDVFEELEAEVAQCAVDRKHDAIDLKNLLIANDNLIAECLSQEVFSVSTNSELNVARFTKMHVANTSIEARCLALEAKLANLRNKSYHENQEELINHFSKLEVNHLNLQLKYQKLKDSIRNNQPTPDKDTPDFNSVFVIGKMQASLQGKDNIIRQLKKQLSQLQATRSDTDRTLKVQTTDSQITQLTDQITNLRAQNDLFSAENDKINKAKVQPQVLTRANHAVVVESIVPRLRNNRDAHLDYLRHLKESIETIHDIIEEAKVVRPLDRSIVSSCRYTKHSQELLEYAIDTCPQGSQQQAKQLAHIPLIGKKQVTVATSSDKSDRTTHKHDVTVKTQKTNVPVPPSTGVKRCPKASGSQPKSNPKTNRISPAKGANKLPVEDPPRTNKSHLRTTNCVDSSSCLKHTVINSNSDSICRTCNKCLTSFDHDMCVATYVKSVVIPHSTRHNGKDVRKMKQIWKPKQVRQVWKPTGKVLTTIGHQ